MNSPITIPVPVNDHRAELSTAQQDWPGKTLRNPEGSPLLAAAASIRGLADAEVFLLNKLLLPRAAMLETLDAFLTEKIGPNWPREWEQFTKEKGKNENTEHHCFTDGRSRLLGTAESRAALTLK